MKCSQCGAQNPEDRNYCTGCGNDLNAQSNSEAVLVDNNPDATETVFTKMPEKFTQSESVYQTLSEAQKQVAQMPLGQNIDPDVADVNPIVFGRPKKSLMPRIFIVIGILFILAAILCGIFFKDIQKAFVGQAKFYVMQEADALSDGSDAKKKLTELINQSMNITGTAKIIQTGEKSSELGLEDAQVKFKYNNDSKNSVSKVELDLTDGEKSIMSLLVQEIDGRMGLSLGETPDKQVVTDSARFLTNILVGDEDEIKKITGMSKKGFKKFSNRYLEKVLLDSIPKENIIKGKTDFEGEKCTTTQFVIDAKVVKNASVALTNEIENDKELDLLINKSIEYLKEKAKSVEQIQGNNADEKDFPTAEEVKKAIKDFALESGKGIDVNSKGSIKYTVFYNKSYKIVNRELASNGQELSQIATYEKDGKNITQITVDYLTIKNVATETKESYSAVLSVIGKSVGDEGDVKYFDVTYDYKKNATVNNVPVFEGKADIQRFTMESDSESDKVTITSTKKGSDGLEVKLITQSNGVEVGIICDLKISDKPDVAGVKVPAKSTATLDDLNLNLKAPNTNSGLVQGSNNNDADEKGYDFSSNGDDDKNSATSSNNDNSASSNNDNSASSNNDNSATSSNDDNSATSSNNDNSATSSNTDKWDVSYGDDDDWGI